MIDLSKIAINIQNNAKEIAESVCIVNGAIMPLNEIDSMGMDEFNYRARLNMPLHLYQYYPDKDVQIEKTGELVNYSILAIENNTVFLQTPTAFNDVYDSDVNINYSEYERIRLAEYCNRSNIKIDESLTGPEIGDVLVKAMWECMHEYKNLDTFFTRVPETERERLANEVFITSIVSEYIKTGNFGNAVTSAIRSEYNNFLFKLQSVFRTTCFSTTPYSQLMWGGAYANNHRGFCIEYTIKPQEKAFEEVYYNLFPLIYCKNRPEMSSRLVAMRDKDLTKEIIWDIYSNGVLRKSIDWAFQNEWRLVLPIHKENETQYNVKFFPITRVFLGNRMTAERRSKLIDICQRINIPYTGVRRKASVFEMESCPILCEQCSQYLKSLTPSL